VLCGGCLDAAAGPLAEAEDDELGGLHGGEADVDEELPAVAHVGGVELFVALDEEGLLR
jgi:hypothetical protein